MNQAPAGLGNVRFSDLHPTLEDGAESVLAGLRQSQKSLNPMWFYDKRGSELFDDITRLPEYYPTRTERALLEKHAVSIASACGVGGLLIEPGSGSSEKVRLLLDALEPALYVPVDISAEFLFEAATKLGSEFDWLQIHAVCADFNQSWAFVEQMPEIQRTIFYPGSTIGNLEPDMAATFLSKLASLIGEDGGVLIGVDTHKATAILDAAYNDSAGVTAAFNLNILRRLNEMLHADFIESNFDHRAFYNEALHRIEMHLVSSIDQRVHCAGEVFSFAKGESIHTESSYKYSREAFTSLAQKSQLRIEQSWLDESKMFSLHYLTRAEGFS